MTNRLKKDFFICPDFYSEMAGVCTLSGLGVPKNIRQCGLWAVLPYSISDPTKFQPRNSRNCSKSIMGTYSPLCHLSILRKVNQNGVFNRERSSANVTGNPENGTQMGQGKEINGKATWTIYPNFKSVGREETIMKLIHAFFLAFAIGFIVIQLEHGLPRIENRTLEVRP